MKKAIVIAPYVLLAIIILIAIYNMFWSPGNGFWNASIAQLLTPLVAVCLTFLATQLKNDQREAKKHAEAIIEKIQATVSNEKFYYFKDFDDKEMLQNEIQMTNRKMSNCIEILVKYSINLGFKEDAEYIKGEFERYRELIDSSSANTESLSGLYLAFKNYAENISSKCDQICVKLYCK